MEEVDKSIYWRAVYKSGEVLEQLENTQEILYENIDKQNLKAFFLLGSLIDIGVDLEKGTLFLAGNEVKFNGFSSFKVPYRLIYYIKMSGVVGAERQIQKVYCLGLQTTIERKNLKLLAEISGNRIVITMRKGEAIQG
jgi:hypothetical protein